MATKKTKKIEPAFDWQKCQDMANDALQNIITSFCNRIGDKGMDELISRRAPKAAFKEAFGLINGMEFNDEKNGIKVNIFADKFSYVPLTGAYIVKCTIKKQVKHGKESIADSFVRYVWFDGFESKHSAVLITAIDGILDNMADTLREEYFNIVHEINGD